MRAALPVPVLLVLATALSAPLCVGAFPCPKGQTFCALKLHCYDLQTSSESCGSCSNSCAATETCIAGKCQKKCDPPCRFDEICLGGTCVKLGGGGADPHMVGFNGARFRFDGIPGRVFAVLSSPDLQVNALFSERHQSGAPSNGTFMTAFGIKTRAGRTANLTITPPRPDRQPTEYVEVSVDGTAAPFEATSAPSASVDADAAALAITSALDAQGRPTYTIECPTASVQIAWSRSREVEFFTFGVALRPGVGAVHGIIGQTYDRPRIGPAMSGLQQWNGWAEDAWSVHVEGRQCDYVVSGLFESDFAYNKFGLPSQLQMTKARKLVQGDAEAVFAMITV